MIFLSSVYVDMHNYLMLPYAAKTSKMYVFFVGPEQLECTCCLLGQFTFASCCRNLCKMNGVALQSLKSRQNMKAIIKT